MISLELVKKIKLATVAVGLRIPKNPEPVYVSGSGVFIHSNGYLMTASHVVSDCIKKQADLKKERTNTLITTMRYIPDKNGLLYNYNDIHGGHGIQTNPIDGTRYNWDVFIAKTLAKKPQPFLEIKKPSKFKIMDEIAMCGYPGGSATLNVTSNPTQFTISPVIQLGHISGLMPTDEALVTQGIQTDIIGTGGSSGSPILDTRDGKIIAIALQVVATYYNVKFGEKRVKGTTNTGLVSGVTNFVIQCLNDITKAWEMGKDSPKKLTMQYATLKSHTILN